MREPNDRPDDLPVELVPAAAEALERAAIDVSVTTARRFPRTILAFQRDLETWATATPEIATECFYVLERENRRTGKTTRIVGPSVRFAELILASYRNLAVDVRIENDDGQRVTIVAVARDMERNVAQRVPVVRRVTDREGRRYSDDMVNVTIQAAASIAKRNAIMGVVPRALWTAVLEKAKALARGDAMSMTERIGKALQAFQAVGVTEARLLGFVGKPSVKDLDAEDLLALRVAMDEIKKGERDPDTIKAAEEAKPASPAATAEAAAAGAAAMGQPSTAAPAGGAQAAPPKAAARRKPASAEPTAPAQGQPAAPTTTAPATSKGDDAVAEGAV